MRFTDSEIQSTGAFLQGELERLDPELYAPIADFTWSRDIDLRNDVTIADEITSFILSNYAGGFGNAGSGKAWIKGMETATIRPSVSMTKVTTPLTPWGMEVSYSIFDLQKAMQAGRPIDTQLYDAMKLKHQLDIDMQVYLGDDAVGVKGLLNNDSVVTKSNVGTFAPGVDDPKKVLDQVNNILNEGWKATQYTRIPSTILVPPTVFSAWASTQLPNVNMNLLQFIAANNIYTATTGTQLAIRPVKWLADKSINSGKGRIVAYTKARDVVRFPLVQLQSLPVQFRGFEQAVPYFGALGGVEFVRPEMVFYGDLTE